MNLDPLPTFMIINKITFIDSTTCISENPSAMLLTICHFPHIFIPILVYLGKDFGFNGNGMGILNPLPA